MVEPDALCYAYDRPKAAFFTEGKAYKALVVAQQRRAAENNPQAEERFYRCPFPRKLSRLTEVHFHLTSMPLSRHKELFPDQEETHVHQD